MSVRVVFEAYHRNHINCLLLCLFFFLNVTSEYPQVKHSSTYLNKNQECLLNFMGFWKYNRWSSVCLKTKRLVFPTHFGVVQVTREMRL